MHMPSNKGSKSNEQLTFESPHLQRPKVTTSPAHSTYKRFVSIQSG